ncbi:hypothetical protein HGA88_04750 [Candidatus Roizmanbacteria bacterium]|nr:hypothetical protein [Candidatus Roizmanbacteria bacterium]
MDSQNTNPPKSNQNVAELQTLLSWRAPLRAYKKRGKNVLRFYVALSILLSLIILFFGDKILLIPLWAVMFLFYVLTITPPAEVENKFTVFGVETAGISLRWESLGSFYFTKRFGFDILTIIGQSPYYFRCYLVIPNEEIKKGVMSLLSERLLYVEHPEKTFVDKMVDWFTYLIPDDEEKETEKKEVTAQESSAPYAQTQAPASL